MNLDWNKIRERRESLKISQAQLSKLTHISWTSLSLMETGKRKLIRGKHLRILSQVLDIPMDDLVKK